MSTIRPSGVSLVTRPDIDRAFGAEIATDRAYNNIQRLMNDVAKGELKVVIDKTFPLSEAAAAHAYIESRKAVGRVLLIP